MSYVVVGLNHRTVPLEILERMSIGSDELPKALHNLARREHLAEVSVLSTCNRTEIYALCTRFHQAVHDVSEFLAEQSGVETERFSEHLYTYYDDAAVVHLFGVAAGVDSMILGEGEILGQVREAWGVATREGTSRQALSRAFRRAVEVGKRSRAETAIGRGAVSVSSAAVALASERTGSLSGRRVLVLGAGDMGEGMAVALAAAGVEEIVIANRSVKRGSELAAKVRGKAIGLQSLPKAIAVADVLLTSTGALSIVLDRGEVEAIMRRRFGKPLLIVDVAVPRDIDPGAASVPGVTLLDMDDLRTFAEHGMDRRRREVTKVRSIIDEELERFRQERAAREMAPLITQLHAKAEGVRVAELERFASRLAGLDQRQREAVEALTVGIAKKLLHEPTVRMKDAAGSALGELYGDALAALFDLSGDLSGRGEIGSPESPADPIETGDAGDRPARRRT